MSERLSPPTESWRPQRHAGWAGSQVKQVAVIAAGVVALLAVGVGGYTLGGRGPRAVPVVEADLRPLRVRPDNPGGMQVAGAEEQIMGGDGSAAEAMAPPPENPAPQALRAQIKARQPVPEPAQAAEAPLPIPAPASPLPIPPAAPPAPMVAAPVAAAPISPAAAPATSPPMQVQLAAMDSAAGASAEWLRLSKRAPDLLASRHPAILQVEHGGRTLYRLRTGGFADLAQATAFCSAMRAKGAACAIASF